MILYICFSSGPIELIMNCLRLPVTSAPVAAATPLIVYITSPSGAELKALDTVTELALKEEIDLVSTLTSSDQKFCTILPLSSFKLLAFACESIALPSSSKSIKSPCK